MTLRSAFYLTVRFIALTVLVSVALLSCKKEKTETGDGIKKLTDVVKPAWLSIVTNNGMALYEGGTPPEVNGKFKMNPYRFDFDNYSQPGVYPQPGTIMSDLVIEFKNQNGQKLSVNFVGNYLNGIELKNPFVTGSGNQFTVCFTARVAGGMSAIYNYDFAYLFSGKVEGNTIKDLKMARVGLTKAAEGFTVEGQVALFSDANTVSEKLP